jgi:predicted RNA binding protein YcfA (HicA-like mRNA interferase family)
MKKLERQREQLMKSYGFTLHRQSSHMIWKDLAGRIVTTSKTPSDINSLRQIERQLKRMGAVA